MQMIEFSFIDGRYSDNLEVLKNFGLNDKRDQLKAFFGLINSKLDRDLKIYANSCSKNANILKIFLKKIDSYIYPNFVMRQKSSKVTNLFVKEAIFINQFFKRLDIAKYRFLTKNITLKNIDKIDSKLDLNKLISIIFNGKNIGFEVKSEDMFLSFVYNRVKIKNRDKNVVQNSNYIEIKSDNLPSTLLYPYWKKFDELTSIKDDISKAFSELKYDNYEQIYLIYPKHDNFKRHIQIKNSSIEKEHILKIVPYSLVRNQIKG